MLKNTEVEPKYFNFRLFLDDYVIKTPFQEKPLELSRKVGLSYTGSRAHSNSVKLYYGELEEIQTFCCHGESEETQPNSSTTNPEPFSLSKFQPKKDSICFNDLASIFSLTSAPKSLRFEDMAGGLQDRHFETLKTRLLEMFEKPHRAPSMRASV